MTHKKILARHGYLTRLAALLLVIFLLCGCSDESGGGTGNGNHTDPEGSLPESGYGNPDGSGSPVDEAETEEFLAFCDDLFAEMVLTNTINLHYTIADPVAYGFEDYEVSLGTWDPSTAEQDYADLRRMQTLLADFDREVLSIDARLTYDLLEDYLTEIIAAEPYHLYAEPLTTTSGDHITLPILMAEYTFYSARDVEDYLLLIQDMPRYFATIEAYERARADAGLFMSDDMADTVIDQCEDFLADPENNFLLVTLQDRLDALTDLTEDEKTAYTEQIETAVTACAFPAYESLITTLKTLKDTADNPQDDETGICSLPLGKEYFSHLLRTDVGTDKSAEELMVWLEDEMNESVLVISLQYDEDVDADMYDTSDMLEDPLEILNDLQEKIQEDFPSVDGTTYDVKYVPKALEESSSPAFYLTPPMDRSDENVIYVNEAYYDPSEIYATLAHEGYPGHLLQTVYFNRSCTIPLRQMLSCSGYVEGWATYVELQAYDWADQYADITANVLSANQKATLCLYGMMDIGINYEGWNKEQTGDFLYKYFGIDDEEVAEDVFDAIIGEPANYLNYVVGCLEWQEIREKQENLLGKDFSALEFHETALEIGPCPFYILRRYLMLY